VSKTFNTQNYNNSHMAERNIEEEEKCLIRVKEILVQITEMVDSIQRGLPHKPPLDLIGELQKLETEAKNIVTHSGILRRKLQGQLS